jgi:hypothetical protein
MVQLNFTSEFIYLVGYDFFYKHVLIEKLIIFVMSGKIPISYVVGVS